MDLANVGSESELGEVVETSGTSSRQKAKSAERSRLVEVRSKLQRKTRKLTVRIENSQNENLRNLLSRF